MKYRGCSREDIIQNYRQQIDEYDRQLAEGRIFIDHESGKRDVRSELLRERNAVLEHYGYEIP
jgi:hypothetical protein